MGPRFLVVLGAAAAVGLAGSAAGAPTAKLHGSNFWSNCRFSHTANDDPIVLPRHPGFSHPHTFFGNVSTDAYSTLASLRRAATTCKPRADRAAYWVPTLFQNGREVRPAKAQLYYVVHGYRQMRAFPPGLRMVAGAALAGAGRRRPRRGPARSRSSQRGRRRRRGGRRARPGAAPGCARSGRRVGRRRPTPRRASAGGP